MRTSPAPLRCGRRFSGISGPSPSSPRARLPESSVMDLTGRHSNHDVAAAIRNHRADLRSARSGTESRSAGHRAAPRMTAMDITIHESFLPHDDRDASLALYRDTLGFEVRNDVGYG